MKSLLPVLLLFVVVAFAACQDSFDKTLQREAAAFTRKHCPQQLDEYTRLDSAAYDPATRIYRRFFTIAAHTPPTVWQNTEHLRAALLQELRGDASWNACKEQRISFSYDYRYAETGARAALIVLTAADYGA